MANMIRGISDNGGVVFYGVDSTNIVAEASASTRPAPSPARPWGGCSPPLP